ncbi:hypothetical protein P26059A_0100 [Curvibacter phage P26059A]|nr:hypothetical protein P26059A_0100 [Curvibacter phage P26059A]
MKTKDTTLSDLFMQTALSLHRSSAESMECVCRFLRNNPQAYRGFVEAFKPDKMSVVDRWFDKYRGDSCKVPKKELQAIKAHRITAVLFMHELAKDFEHQAMLQENYEKFKENLGKS